MLLGPGSDSPAELLCWPCGTLSAGSCFPNFWSGVWLISVEALDLLRPKPALCGEGEKWREFFALARKEEAFCPTNEERRFLSSLLPVVSGLGLTPLAPLVGDGNGAFGLPPDERLSFIIGRGAVVAGDDDKTGDGIEGFEVGADADIPVPMAPVGEFAPSTGLGTSLGDAAGEELELPNMRFNKPPDEEKLLLCLPASVLMAWLSAFWLCLSVEL